MSKLNWRRSEMKARKDYLRKMSEKSSNILKHATYDNLFKGIVDELTKNKFYGLFAFVNANPNEPELFGQKTIISNFKISNDSKRLCTNIFVNAIYGVATQFNITPDKFLGEIAAKLADFDLSITEEEKWK